MFFVVPQDSGAGSLALGENYEAAWPGHDSDGYPTLTGARAACPKGWRVVQATMTSRSNGIGEPLWLIKGVQ